VEEKEERVENGRSGGEGGENRVEERMEKVAVG
jgi:hypothetical protein